VKMILLSLKTIIKSLTAFPNVIGLQDSVIIICNAYDPDGDTLVYDWITDGKVRIKDGQAGGYFLYHTFENSRIVYPRESLAPPDTCWVQCFARDVKGGQAASLVTFIVLADSTIE
jgi:hypothetical protein